MSSDTANAVLGAAILVVLLPLIWLAARFAAKLGDRYSARLLAPLAPRIGGRVNIDPPCIEAQHQGRSLRVSFTKQQSVGSGEGAMSINALHVDVLRLTGRQDWAIVYLSTNWRGSDRVLFTEAPDRALGQRLEAAGVLAAVQAVNQPTQHYVVARFDARAGALHYTDDVAPRVVPDAAQFERQVALALRLAQINDEVNR